MRTKIVVILIAICAAGGMNPLLANTPFERMDSNRDKLLSRTEFRGDPRAFVRLDKNHDGFISLKEAENTRLAGPMPQVREKPSIPSPGKTTELIFVDTHNHLVGPQSKGEFNLEKSIQVILTAMDAAGVKLNLIMPMPQAPGQKLGLRWEDLLPVIKKYPDRFAALGGGGTLNVMIQESIAEGKVTPQREKEFVARALELVEKGAAGFGEMTTEHFSMSPDHPYETAPCDHPLFLKLADLGAQHKLPIDLHMEAIPEEMPMPSRFQPPNPQVLKPNIESLERLLAHNRQAKIIWVHLGWDNTGKRTVDLTRRLLAENPNLYMSIRIASGMQKQKTSSPTFPLDQEGMLKPEWLELFQEFPDRFLIGSDEIVKPGDDHPSSGSILSTVGLMAQLPEGLRSKIGYENAYSIYRLNK